MMNDDWDSVSSDIPPHSATDSWDAVAAAQPSRKRRSLPPDNLVIEQADTITTPTDLPDTDASGLLSASEPPITEQRSRPPLPDNLTTPNALPSAHPPDDTAPLKEAPFQNPPLHQRAAGTSPRSPETDPSGLPPGSRRSFPAPLSRRALPGVITVLLVLSVLGLLFPLHTTLMNRANADATATVQTGVTALVSQVDATSTAQAAATATTFQQIYSQDTSGTPAFADPLSDDSNGWGTFNASWGACGFNGGAYHFTLVSGGDWSFCNCPSTQNLNNFALQVQMNIIKGDAGGIVFGQNSNDLYTASISSGGIYNLYQYQYQYQYQQWQTLQGGSSPAITTGFNQNNVLTVIVNNGSFYLYVNNQFVTSSNLDAYSLGSASFFAESDNQATDVAFSNLKIWTL